MAGGANKRLTPDDVYALTVAARSVKKHGHRNATLLLLAYRHGLSVSEVVTLKWTMVNFDTGKLHLNRSALPVHSLTGSERKALTNLRQRYPDASFVFVRSDNQPLTPPDVDDIIRKAGDDAEMPVTLEALRDGAALQMEKEGREPDVIRQFLGYD